MTGIRARLLTEPPPGLRSEVTWQFPSAEGIHKLCEAMAENRVLTALDLSSCGVETTAAQSLAGSLPPRLSKLVLGSTPLGVDGIDALAATLQGNSRLRTLSLDLVRCSGSTGGRSFAGLLSGMTSLRGLELQMNALGDDGAVELADGARTLRALTSLDLSTNQISDTGAVALAEALKGFAHLLRLNLHENHLGPVGGTAIASTETFAADAAEDDHREHSLQLHLSAAP